MRVSKRTLLTFLLGILIGFFAVTQLVNPVKPEYGALFALPIVYGFCALFFLGMYENGLGNIGFLFVILLEVVKLVIIPIFMAFGDYSSTFRFLSRENLYKAVALMSWECLWIHISLWITMNTTRWNTNSKKRVPLVFTRPNRLFSFLVLFMTSFLIVTFLLIPESRGLYKTIFEIGDSAFTAAGETSIANYSTGTIVRAMLTLNKMVLDVERIVLPLYIMISFKKRNNSDNFGVFVCLLFSALQFLIISSTLARTVICSFLILYFGTQMYPEKAKFLTRMLFTATVIILVGYFTVRFLVGSRYGTTASNYISSLLNAYFGGVSNVAAGFNMKSGMEGETFWAACYGAIPFNSTLFGLQMTKVQSLYNTANSSYGQIPPMIIEGWYHFGAFFAPVYSAIFASLAYRYGVKFRRTSSPWHAIFDLFFAILCAISISMYDFEIALVWITNLLIPGKLLARMDRKENIE